MKSLFAILLFTICLSKGSAQIQFGIKGGLNVANIPYAQFLTTQKNLTSFNAGVAATFALSAHLFLQSELVYSVQGTVGIFHATAGDETITSTYNYLNLPFLLKYSHHSGLFAETGPQLGIFLNGKTVYDDTLGQSNAKDYIQPGDFGWVFGLGYKIPGMNAGLDVRYNIGLTTTNKYITTDGKSQFNRVLQLDLFYFFK